MPEAAERMALCGPTTEVAQSTLNVRTPETKQEAKYGLLRNMVNMSSNFEIQSVCVPGGNELPAKSRHCDSVRDGLVANAQFNSAIVAFTMNVELMLVEFLHPVPN
jgi:hypothetical protein